MAALPGWLAARYSVAGASPEQVQPAGVDLRVGSIYALNGEGVLLRSHRRVPQGVPVEPRDGVWHLEPGAYRVRFLDEVYVPAGSVGFCYPRSSLLRMGAVLHCAVWDPGYRGRGEALLVVHNPYGVVIGEGARVAQLVLLRLAGLAGSVYRGYYQGEGLGTG